MMFLDVSTPKFPNTFTMVDDEDYERLSRSNWYAAKYGERLYVRRAVAKVGISIHREIMSPPLGLVVDHIDGNPLNNQKANLRICTQAQNLQNQSRHRNGRSSIYKGVYYWKQKKLFRAHICVDRKQIFLGYFKQESDAARAYNAAAVKHRGEYAKLNAIPPK